MQTDHAVNDALKNFDDYEIRVYTRFATEWRDQRLTDGSPGEVAFWNALISLFVEERHRRKDEIRQLERMYQATEERPSANHPKPIRSGGM
ncbi:MAG: hypothetical protein R3B83_17365 [Nitrospirales bacterium]|nr:hypothetical protein [Nitrospira sp.]MCB9711848.1 hypothetical protein [Nitrospiraceae bacterium]MDR4487512.1 hypothetical protein [Nitrospirales bacterium]MDR4489272.1 hypothetical protein [Nitrospirales bacterium]HQU29580.1 hypothetical protein [Nitrospirales bacterium]